MSLSKNGQRIEVRYTTESANYYRLTALTVSLGQEALKMQFNKIYTPGLLHYVLGYKTVLNELKTLKENKCISARQWCHLFPAVPELVSADNFDVSLLTVLLRNICSLPTPPRGWDNLPSSEDTTLSADIVRISYYRNELAHSAKRSIDNETFENYWKIVSEAVVRLLGESQRPVINHLKKGPLEPKMAEADYLLRGDKGEEGQEPQTDYHCATSIAGALLSNESLTACSLSDKKVGEGEEGQEPQTDDHCATSIAGALLSNEPLTACSLSGKKVVDDGEASFAKVLEENKTLIHLDLSNNEIGDHGACCIAKAIEKNTTLKSLNLSKNRIGDKGAIALANALKMNKTLALSD